MTLKSYQILGENFQKLPNCLLCRLARANNQKIRDHLGILNVGLLKYRLVIRSGLGESFQHKASLDQGVEPVAQGVVKVWRLKFTHAFHRFWWRSAE